MQLDSLDDNRGFCPDLPASDASAADAAALGDPLLDLQMRLLESSGAGTAMLLLRAPLACHTGMATFTKAGVSGAT